MSFPGIYDAFISLLLSVEVSHVIIPVKVSLFLLGTFNIQDGGVGIMS